MMGVYTKGGYIDGLSYDDTPEPYSSGPDDDGYDRMVARIDAGEECPDCRQTDRITRWMALGLELFECGCGCKWFDFVTRPAG